MIIKGDSSEINWLYELSSNKKPLPGKVCKLKPGIDVLFKMLSRCL